MSDRTGKPVVGWSEHEILVCLINAIETNGVKLDFNSISYHPGRTVSGFTQKLTAVKKSLKPEIDAINAGQPIPEAAVTPKKAAGRKRKAKSDDENGEIETPKKRGRAKKQAVMEEELDKPVKHEPEDNFGVEVEAENEVDL